VKKILIIIGIILLAPGCDDSAPPCQCDDTTPPPPRETIKATIFLTNLPNEFVYDSELYTKPTSYSWVISFDINNDSVINEGDIGFMSGVYLAKNSEATVFKREQLEADLFKYVNYPTGGTAYIESITKIEIESTEKSLTFIAPIGLHESLGAISSGTQIYVFTQHRDAANTGALFWDYYPSRRTYSIGLDTGWLIDEKLDFEIQPFGPVSGVEFPPIDIEMISVSIGGSTP
jgi:hypothetical protein